jgi:hypothetical protein
VNNLELELAEDISRFTSNPLGFMRYAYPWGEPGSELELFPGPYPWQAEIARHIGDHLRSRDRFQPLRIAVSSGRGIGKSALIGMLCNWGLSTCDDARVIVTANTETQLAVKTWPEISKWFRRSINSHWWTPTATRICVKDRKHADTWRMDRETWSENNVEAFRGLHNSGKRMVFVFDEAAGIADPIWHATEGSLTDEYTEMILIAFSNPSQNSGKFKECFGRMKHRWKTFQIDSRNVPGTNLEEIKRWIEDYGEDSDYVRVNVRGEFPRAGATQFIGGDIVAGARARTVAPEGFKVLAVDVARFGDDQTVLGMRQGGNLRILARLRGLDTMQVAARVMEVMRNEQPRATIIDGDGLGAGVVDCVRHTMRDWSKDRPRIRLQEFHGGGTPFDSSMYFNRRAEVWGMMREWLKEGDIPDEPEIETDLTGPEYYFSSKNQIQLERKEDMKRRGLSSPDVGDMLAMTFAAVPAATEYDEMSNEVDATSFADADRRYWEARL